MMLELLVARENVNTQSNNTHPQDAYLISIDSCVLDGIQYIRNICQPYVPMYSSVATGDSLTLCHLPSIFKHCMYIFDTYMYPPRMSHPQHNTHFISHITAISHYDISLTSHDWSLRHVSYGRCCVAGENNVGI